MSEADWLERKTLRPQDFSNFMTAVSPNYLYIPSGMSKSADTIISQQEMEAGVATKGIHVYAVEFFDSSRGDQQVLARATQCHVGLHRAEHSPRTRALGE